MKYICMSFGWYQELLEEVQTGDFASAESSLHRMLDGGAMIVHVYRETDAENPELVGRHRCLRSFIGGEDSARLPQGSSLTHQVERFLIDPANLTAWLRASETGDSLLEQRWSIIDLWANEGTERRSLYGKALLTAPPGPVPSADLRGY